MNLLFCGDANMADGLLIATLSLLKHVQEPLHIHILTATLASATKVYQPLPERVTRLLTGLVQAKQPAATVTRHDITTMVVATPPTANLETVSTPYCMLRLYADQVAGLPDRLLYLDTDVICRRDPSAFYYQDLTNTELVGVLDYYGRWFFHNQWRMADYINSGVLLMNLAECRQTGLLQKARALCQTQQLFMPDQSALNKLAQHKRIAARRYNDQRRVHRNTVFQHFTTSFRLWPWIHTLTVKPWQVDQVHAQLHLHEYDDLLLDYRQLADQLKG
ncbi:glycosyltransferase [Lacticaseibacillus daqingensis]|uniref:glycosyltransferase n=1 Tax=Lacticaseibacillus daqingensis TaxID=2486014 RepID=UPI000F7879B1|nr:glycosyltransferase [Lacticaseibacillus daqingensis]